MIAPGPQTAFLNEPVLHDRTRAKGQDSFPSPFKVMQRQQGTHRVTGPLYETKPS